MIKIVKNIENKNVGVAYLNLADNYWMIGNKKLAKENYQKYVDLMKSEKKDIKKIPQYVWAKIK